MENLIIIPARAGSKRLKNKNKLILFGKPLILWTIEAAMAANIGDIAISTDCDEIIEIAKNAGVKVYFKRPERLSGDEVSSVDVMMHALLELEDKLNKKYENLILLQPTSPLRTSKHIKDALCLFKEKLSNSLTSIYKLDKPDIYYGNVGIDGFINDWVESIELGGQLLSNSRYCLNGAIYIVKREFLIDNCKILDKNSCVGYIMQSEDSIDIDNFSDFVVADALLKLSLS